MSGKQYDSKQYMLTLKRKESVTSFDDVNLPAERCRIISSYWLILVYKLCKLSAQI